MPVATKIKPIQNMWKRGVVVDISCALGLGTAAGYFWWYGFHTPMVRHRDRVYAKIEDERIRNQGRPIEE